MAKIATQAKVVKEKSLKVNPSKTKSILIKDWYLNWNEYSYPACVVSLKVVAGELGIFCLN